MAKSDLYRLQRANDMFIDKVAKSVLRGTGVMVQCLRVLFALSENLGLVPSTHMVALVLGDLMASAGAHRHQTCTWCIDVYGGKTPIHKQMQSN